MCNCRRSYLIQPLTVAEQNKVGRVARRVGGYDELLRLESQLRDLQAKGITSFKTIIDKDGKHQVVEKTNGD